jgi:hypothetical protein
MFAFVEEAREEDAQLEKNHCQTPISQDEFIINDQVFINWLKIS